MEYFLDFDLPQHLIATLPSDQRDGDRMLVFQNKEIIHDTFVDIVKYFKEGDLIVFNNSKVFKARLEIISSNQEVHSEMLLINQESPTIWTAMMKKARRFKIGEDFKLINGTKAKVIDILEDGLRKIEFHQEFTAHDAEKIGQVPLPPYIIEERKKRGEEIYSQEDETRYQTLFAKYYGSVAAPTASLRFSKHILEQLKNKGVQFAEITLHVGIGTFKPMNSHPDEFEIHKEFISINSDTAKIISSAKQKGNRIIAAGTTVCRALESSQGKVFEGWTNIFIKPGFNFHVIDGLITNFHLPQSTLLLLVQSFIGTKETREIYTEALKQEYRFFSYGDGMLLLK